ncbi:MAG: methyl-accepting chemotaxis protein [Planctomycetota bacterium]|jgi:methyl-accepting chemotaxis protein
MVTEDKAVESRSRNGEPALRNALVTVCAVGALAPLLCFVVTVVLESTLSYCLPIATAAGVGAIGCSWILASRIHRRQSDRAARLATWLDKMSADDTRALELTIQMLGDIETSSQEAENAAGIVKSLDENTRGVAATSEELSSGVNAVAIAAEEISANINSVASTSDQISSNMSAVASATEQMSSNLTTIDSAVGELSKAIHEIAGNAREGAAAPGHAAQAAESTRGIVAELNRSAEEIGQVTSVIQVIAQQTNLLALNAAIEAASAGEAGKGFSVVANEVKELARQTTSATEDISGKIGMIQENTSRAVTAISEIIEIIDKIDELQALITSMVDQQTRASGEISKNVTEAAAGVNEVSKNINESATGVNEVSKGIGEIAAGANEVARNVSEAATGVTDLTTRISEASVMVNEANRYISRAKSAAMECRGGVRTMSVTVDGISDAIQALQATETNGHGTEEEGE